MHLPSPASPKRVQNLKKPEQISTLPLLSVTAVILTVPFLCVWLFKESLYRVVEIAPYLVFHNFVEFFSIIVSFSIFGLGWCAYNQNEDRYSLFISVAFFTIGLFDFMHALSFTGMPSLITPNVPNKASQFWLAARGTEASTFLISAFIPLKCRWRLLSKTSLMCSALCLCTLVFTAVIFFPDYVPDTFIPGVGLTPFKIHAEYVIIFVLAANLIIYWKRLSRTGDRTLNYYLAAFVICIFSELSFTLFKSFYDTYNMIGHIYKILAYVVVYTGIFAASIRKPYEDLRENRNILSLILNSTGEGIYGIGLDNKCTFCNVSAMKMTGYAKPEQIVGADTHDLVHHSHLDGSHFTDSRDFFEKGSFLGHRLEKRNP